MVSRKPYNRSDHINHELVIYVVLIARPWEEVHL